MAVKIFPSVNDVAPVAGDGITIKEANLVSLLAALVNKAFVISGLTAPSSSVNLNLDIALGEAFIKGYWVKLDAATTVSCTNGSLNHIYLKLTKDGGGNVTGATFEVNTTGVAPADSVKVRTATATGGALIATTDARALNPIAFLDESPKVVRAIHGSFTTNSTAANGQSTGATITHGLGTDNVKVIMMAKGDTTANDYLVMARRPDGAIAGIMAGRTDITQTLLPGVPASGDIRFTVKNGPTGTQTMTVFYTIYKED